jgi:hypothetical protein
LAAKRKGFTKSRTVNEPNESILKRVCEKFGRISGASAENRAFRSNSSASLRYFRFNPLRFGMR